MCQDCDDYEAWQLRMQNAPPADRPVPVFSGEAAIYSPEYLERKEGNANGAVPERWRSLWR